jgi:hypothetical protein
MLGAMTALSNRAVPPFTAKLSSEASVSSSTPHGLHYTRALADPFGIAHRQVLRVRRRRVDAPDVRAHTRQVVSVRSVRQSSGSMGSARKTQQQLDADTPIVVPRTAPLAPAIIPATQLRVIVRMRV